MYCLILATVRTRKGLKNARNCRRRINATRRRYGRSAWRLVDDVQVVQAIKYLIPTIPMNVFVQETLSLTPIIQTNVYAKETKFQTKAILVIVFALPIRFLTSTTQSNVFAIMGNFQTWPDNAVNIFFIRLFNTFLRTCAANLGVRGILEVNVCSVISLITKTHFQHVNTFGRVVQTPILARLMRETVTEMTSALETWDVGLATAGLCIQSILIAAKKKVDNLWSGMTESLFLFPDPLFPSAFSMLCSPFFQFSRLKVFNLHFLQKQKNLQF